jgi:bifunctional enzyme CysN/CysC
MNTAELMGERMNIVIAGHVDHGKSTFAGRLLVDAGAIGQEKIAAIRKICDRLGKPFEHAFLLDALKDERTQGITIDTARIFFRSPRREYIILDAPGHIEFLRNMITGAAKAEAALLLIDAKEGIAENSRRHGLMLSILGISKVVVLVNKMDLVDYDRELFDSIQAEYSGFLQGLNVCAQYFIPISARDGDNIVNPSSLMDWYEGPTVLEALDRFETMPPASATALRMPVQDVYKFDERRIVAGTVESGTLRPGDKVVFFPSGKTSVVETVESFGSEALPEVSAGTATGVTLRSQLYVKAGEIMCRADEEALRPYTGTCFKAKIFWIGKIPLQKGRIYKLKLATARVNAVIEDIEYVLNSDTLERCNGRISVEKNDVAVCSLRTLHPVSYDIFGEYEATGRFVLSEDYRISGGGTIIDALVENRNEACEEHRVFHAEYEHKNFVMWFTGLSAAGKSSIADSLRKRFHAMGVRSYVLDGDNMRHGLNSDLGFSSEDRRENIRRIGEVAKLFVDAGLIVMTACISPYREDRENARKLLEREGFIEVYAKCPVEECEKRDPKGLYKKARAGIMKDFTGISAPYEEPDIPEMVLETDKFSIDDCVTMLIDHLIENNYVKKIGSGI